MTIRAYSISEVDDIRRAYALGIYDAEDLGTIYGCSASTITRIVEGTGSYGKIQEDLDRLELLNLIFDLREEGYTEVQISSQLEWNLPRLTYLAGKQDVNRDEWVGKFIQDHKLF